MTIKLAQQAVEDLIANRKVDATGAVTVSKEDLLLLGAQIYGLGQGASTGSIVVPAAKELADELAWMQTERALSDESKVEYVISKVIEANK